MSGWKKLATAGAADAEILNVDNVFRSYLYDGDSQAQNIYNGIALADSPSGDLGSSTLFENYNESLNKSSDLTGNSDGKTFTFSFWIYPVPSNNNTMYIYHTSGSWKNTISWGLNGTIFVAFFNNESSGGTVFEIQNPDLVCPPNTWSHVIFSADMSDTTKRHLYINDSEATPSWSYSNQTIDWTRTNHAVGDDLTASTGNFNGYMAHFFFDKTYRDLSVTSTRRTFIDSARGSTSASTLAALNPILYLPMVSGYSVGENAGTGGNFTGTNSPTIVTDKGTQSVAGVGQGGMVWFKSRNTSTFHAVFDTERGVLERLRTASTNAQDNVTRSLTAFNSNGFNVGNNGIVNQTGREYVAWTFRKAPKFFDVQTWSGNGTAGRTISHNLGCDVGMIWVRRTDSTGNWRVWARADASNAYALFLNGGSAGTSPPQAAIFGNGTSYVAPTSTEFTIGSSADLNASGGTYVAYIFAHNNNDGGFGPNQDQDIIKCGSYTGTGTESLSNVIDVGFHPQLLLLKRLTGGTDDWIILDDMRGFYESRYFNDNGLTRNLVPNSAGAEYNDSLVYPRPNGFALTNNSSKANTNGSKYFYMAINSRPTTPPTSSSEVFDVITQTVDSNLTGTFIEPDISPIGQVDMNILGQRTRNGLPNTYLWDRRRGSRNFWETNRDVDESDRGSTYKISDDSSSGFLDNFSYPSGSVTNNMIYWMWQRRATFLDIITYTGAGTNGQRINHGLGAVPAMIWIKKRGTASDWAVWHKELNGGVNAEDYHLHLNTSAPENTGNEFGQYNSYYPTETDFEVGSSALTNDTNYQFVAYLFGEIDGVTKMGRYSGNGSSLAVDCGFSSGAKFVLIKSTSSTNGAQWCALDTARGITAGNDPVLQLNNTNAELSVDCIDPSNSGFTVVQEANRNLNRNGDDYVYYAIATP